MMRKRELLSWMKNERRSYKMLSKCMPLATMRRSKSEIRFSRKGCRPPEELKRLYLGLFWERFEAKEKKIVLAESIELIKAKIKERLVITGNHAFLKRQSPEPIMTEASVPQREAITTKFRGGRRDLNPQPLGPQPSALPIELRPPMTHYYQIPLWASMNAIAYADGRTRTSNLLLRRELLYPIKLHRPLFISSAAERSQPAWGQSPIRIFACNRKR